MFGEMNPRGLANGRVGHTLVYRGTDVAVGAGANVPFDLKMRDTEGIWSPALNAAVIRRTGLYFVQVQLTNLNPATASAARIFLNGDPHSTGAQIAATYFQANLFTLLNAGDVINASVSNAITVQAVTKRSRMEIVGPF